MEESGEGFPNASLSKGCSVFDSPKVVSQRSDQTRNERIENTDNLTTNGNNVDEVIQADSVEIADENQTAEVEITSNSEIQTSRIESTLQCVFTCQ